MALLKPGFTPRRYQETILSTAAGNNTLVVLPTGMGKTAIAAMLAAHRLDQNDDAKIVFLAPTKPLVQQHLDTFTELFDLPEEDFSLLTGSVTPAKRVKLWNESRFIFSTPQGLENDLISNKISLQDVGLLVFDEAHRATGDYAYVYIADQYHKKALHERVLALTASPGSDEETIRTVCENLHIEAIELRSPEDPELQEYTQDVDTRFLEVTLDSYLKRIQSYLQKCYQRKLDDAKSLGVLKGDTRNYNKTTLLKMQSALHAQTAQGDKGFDVLKTISLLAEALKVQHALELCETQTVRALSAYLHQLQSLSRTSKTKAVQNLVKDADFKAAVILADRAVEEGVEHPKVARLKEHLTKAFMTGQDKKFIIFTQFRITATVLKEELKDLATADIFVGQAKKGTTGLSQKEQKRMVERFREGEFSILIATSVAEEGLDIPSVDGVIFYEPIPSAIRTVQRRGRTGRHSAGSVAILIAKNTRDEGYRWSAHHKEKRMYRTIAKLKKSFTGPSKEPAKAQPTLSSYEKPQKITITADYREKGSAVMKALLADDATLDLKQLEVGDYQVGDDVVVEYKTVKDFVDSIVDGRLLSQLSALRSVYKPVLILEGQEDLYAQRRVNPAAIRGMLATIMLSYHIPLLRTSSAQDTAGVLLAMAKRVQQHDDRSHTPHSAKPWTLKERQEYVVGSLPGIGPKLAKPLLKHFGTVRQVLEATEEELQDVELIGEKKAKTIQDVLDQPYES
ncbi:DEAD/DEAH box helicase [Candidatus Woesearchaeota archaeon]|nr:DEAD/DEAH box helicase [Candidatus Woesearchaeota archaeon]